MFTDNITNLLLNQIAHKENMQKKSPLTFSLNSVIAFQLELTGIM